MKKTLFFAIFVLIFTVASSQVFQDTQNLTRLTSVSSGTDNLTVYTQKVLHWDRNKHIALSKNIAGKNVFTLITDGSIEAAENVTVGNYFNVKDFAIEGDSLYFCGSVNDNGSEVAFLAYIGIEDLFSSKNIIEPIDFGPVIIPGIRYTLINKAYQDSIFSIDRIEVFKDSVNKVVVAGIGKMYYGKPPYEKMIWDNFGSYETSFVDPPEYYLDFFMFYTIKEDSAICNFIDVIGGATPIYDIANDFELYYIPSDTIDNCYYNKFADITETDNKIYLTSLNYMDTTVWEYPNHTFFMDIIAFDKQSHQQQTGRVNLITPIHQAYGIKTTHTIKDNIAIVYNTCYNSYNQYSCAFTLSPTGNNSFITSKTFIFDTLGRGFKIYDCEHLAKENELVVLKQSILREQKEDFIFHLKLNDTITSSYDYVMYKINDKDGFGIYCNDLSVSNLYDYTVSGYISENRMLIFDTKNYVSLFESPCITMEKYPISVLNPFLITPIPPLTQGSFYHPVRSVSDNQLTILHLSQTIQKVFIQYSIKPIKKNSEIKIHCLK